MGSSETGLKSPLVAHFHFCAETGHKLDIVWEGDGHSFGGLNGDGLVEAEAGDR